MALGLGGCAAERTDVTFEVSAGGYARAFDAAKEVLREAGFELDRVDARAGVITTRSKGSAGIATPWVGDESTIEQEFDDLIHQQRRTAVVCSTGARLTIEFFQIHR